MEADAAKAHLEVAQPVDQAGACHVLPVCHVSTWDGKLGACALRAPEVFAGFARPLGEGDACQQRLFSRSTL